MWSRRHHHCAPGRWADLPNFFLMTFKIFFWSNFLGSPWTVVRVLRPLRSVGRRGSAGAATGARVVQACTRGMMQALVGWSDGGRGDGLARGTEAVARETAR